MPTFHELTPLARALTIRHIFRKPRMSAAIGFAFAIPYVQVQAQEVEFNIPAQSLSSALQEFGRQTNLQVLYNSSDLQGARSNELKGRFNLSQAVSELLKGTGVSSYSLQGNTLTLSTNNSSALELGATTVTDQALNATTEGTRSYTTGSMQTATKLPLSIRETPQSVTVITRQRMDDQAMNNLDDVVKNTPGLTNLPNGPKRPQFYARGFMVDNIMYDGLPSSVTGGYTQDTISSADLAIYDRVEIVRGATGLMQGAGNPAAAINLVRKRPTREAQVSVTGSAGSWDRYRTELDASSPLNDAGTLRGRIVTAYQNGNSFQDVVDNERGLLYGILEADLAESTTLTIGASLQNDNNTQSWGGLPVASNGTDLHLSRSTFLGNDWDYWDQNNTFAFAGLEHRFNNDWKMNLTANKIWARVNYLGTKVYLRNGSYDQGVGDYSYLDDQSSYDFYASGPFQLFGRKHELVAGASHREEIFDGHGGGSYTYNGMNIFDWNHGMVPKPEIGETWLQNSDETQKGIYTTARFNIADPLKVILGGRLDWYDLEGQTLWSDSDYKITRQVTKYAGLIYDLNDQHSVYVSYTDIFKPQNYFDTSNNLIKPVEGKNYEIGIKSEYFDGALNASAAIFQIDQENRAKKVVDQTLCPVSITCYEAAGKVRSKGIELEIQGAITPDWQVAAGYTYTEAKYKKDANPDNEGKLFLTDAPRHLFKLSSTYWLQGEWQKWRVGGSIYAQNTIYNKGTSSGTPYYIEQEAYTLVDLMVGFKPTEHIDARLNLNNAFDKKYYLNIAPSSYYAESIYGDPRNLMLTVKYDF